MHYRLKDWSQPTYPALNAQLRHKKSFAIWICEINRPDSDSNECPITCRTLKPLFSLTLWTTRLRLSLQIMFCLFFWQMLISEVTGWAGKQKHHYTRRKPGFIWVRNHTFSPEAQRPASHVYKHYQVHFTVRFIHQKMTFQWQENNASLKKQKHEQEKKENPS